MRAAVDPRSRKGHSGRRAGQGRHPMDMAQFHDPMALAVMALAAAIVGLAKGGLAGMGTMAVPVLALVLSPVQAAAILLPILCLTDIVATYTWWGTWSRRTLALMLPGALAGI